MRGVIPGCGNDASRGYGGSAMQVPLMRRELPADVDFAALHEIAPRRYPCLLQSVAHGTGRSRFDLLLAFPREGLRLDPDGRVRDLAGVERGSNFLAELDRAWRAEAPDGHHDPCPEDELPFHGGWALYLGYEMAAQIEARLVLPAAPGAMPVALALRCPVAIIRDHESGRVDVVVECDSDADEAFALIQADCAALSGSSASSSNEPRYFAQPQPEPPEAFLQGAEHALEYIRAGDVFQVNLSRGWSAPLPQDIHPLALYHALCRANPAPFAGLFAWDDWMVMSSSPERLLSVRGGIVETRPIAGTRPRFDGDDDAERVRELVGHPKERAEHIMLIDLMRNDLSRIATPGSVIVDELMTVESYAHVHHIVSNVRATLRPDATPIDAIGAVFPGGTITGCPKVRCMEIIAELEGVGRGPYTGSFGYLDRNGTLDLNILIRTLWLHRGMLRLRAGAGVVADSQPQAELAETQAKARGLLRALGMAG